MANLDQLRTQLKKEQDPISQLQKERDPRSQLNKDLRTEKLHDDRSLTRRSHG
jgi:hypothetical protein